MSNRKNGKQTKPVDARDVEMGMSCLPLFDVKLHLGESKVYTGALQATGVLEGCYTVSPARLKTFFELADGLFPRNRRDRNQAFGLSLPEKIDAVAAKQSKTHAIEHGAR